MRGSFKKVIQKVKKHTLRIVLIIDWDYCNISAIFLFLMETNLDVVTVKKSVFDLTFFSISFII